MVLIQKTQCPTFLPPQHTSQCPLPEKLTKTHWFTTVAAEPTENKGVGLFKFSEHINAFL